MAQTQGGKLILVRHGETEANLHRRFADSNDISLTHTGRLQAHEIALHLSREFHPEVLVSSTYLRARQTSELIARVIGLATEAIGGIQERDFGCLKGHPYEQLREQMSRADCRDPLWRPAGGETLDDVRLRSIAAITALRVRYPGREIVIVTHGAVIQAICAHITGDWSEASVPPNCGIVTIKSEGQAWHTPILSGEWDMIGTRA